jgi:hypothetical protein
VVSAAGLGEAAHPVAEPVAAERDVDADRDAAGDQVVDHLLAHAEEVFDGDRAVGGDHGLAQDAVVGGERERGRRGHELVLDAEVAQRPVEVHGLAVGDVGVLGAVQGEHRSADAAGEGPSAMSRSIPVRMSVHSS